MMTRRRLLQNASVAGIAAVLGGGIGCFRPPHRPGKLLGRVPFDEPFTAPLGEVLASGLDGLFVLDPLDPHSPELDHAQQPVLHPDLSTRPA